jgi:hypothetical protein
MIYQIDQQISWLIASLGNISILSETQIEESSVWPERSATIRAFAVRLTENV